MVDALINGFRDFRKGAYEGANPPMPELIAKGQDPNYFVVSCIDSRSNPATLFNAWPGTFFGHQAMGAIVRPYEEGTALAAALQFALIYNNVKNLIVLGHTHCGAMAALVDRIDDNDILSFIKVADNARLKSETAKPANDQEMLRCCERLTILESVENLKTYPSVKQALREKNLIIKPWLFDMDAGDILEYNDNNQNFESLTRGQHV